MGIETLPVGTHDKLKIATQRKMELESELKKRKLDLENWQKKLTEHKAKASSMDEENQALHTELKKVKSIEMALQTKAAEAKHGKENNRNKEKAIELECNAGDSGITSMNEDISQNQDAIGNSSVHDVHDASTSNNSINVASNQPSPKKLKPSNSFTKVQKSFSPQRPTAQQTNACTASNLESSAPKQPNECGDYEDTTFLRINNTGLNKTPVKENNALQFGSIEGPSESPITVDEREKEKMSQGSSPFGYGFPGAPSFGEDGTFGVGQAFGDGPGFGGETGFSGGSGFAGGSDFGGSAFGGSAGFGAASGDSSNFTSGFGGFNF